MSESAVSKPVWRALFIMALTLVVLSVALSVHCQTVCVEDPIVAFTTVQERQPLRAQVEGWVREKGFKVGCESQDWDLVIEPLAGTTGSDSIYFIASTVSNAGTTLGTVTVRPDSYGFHSWLVMLFPAGRVVAADRQLGTSLHGGVKKVLRRTVKSRSKRGLHIIE